MMKFDHFKIFSMLLAIAYALIGAKATYGMLHGGHFVSALVVAFAAVSFAIGHWFMHYWAYMATVTISLVFNLFSVFYFFPLFGYENSEKATENPILWFAALTATVMTTTVYIYLNQKKMAKSPFNRTAG